MAETDGQSLRYFYLPEPKAYDIPYKAPPSGANPVVRGIPLALGAPLIEKVPGVAGFLYKNAGFTELRKLKAIEDGDHRYDPTVIPIETDGLTTAPKYAEEAELRSVEYSGAGESRYWGVKDYHEAYKSGKTTPTKVVNTLLPIIRRDVKSPTDHSIAFLQSQVDLVLAAAEASTKRWSAGTPLGVLDGVPVAVKDEVDLKGYQQTFGSAKVFKESSDFTSWAVAKWEEAGAIVVGKTNMHEVGMDTTNNNPTHGTPRNPFNKEYYTGGSSGGSGYAVGAGLVPFTLGCDGGGSIRIPASYCGIFGLKTSHSRVSTRPTPNLAGTNTVSGPMAADMSSLEVAYRVMATPDPGSTHSSRFPFPRRITAPRKKLLGICRPWLDRADDSAKKAIDDAITYLKEKAGYEVIDIVIPLINEGQTAHAITIMNEGYNGSNDHTYLQPANRVLMAVASKCTANDFLNAQKIRQIQMQHLSYLFTTHPDLIIITAATPNAGAVIGSHADLVRGVSDGDMTTRSMEYVYLANFCGCPAITIPAGFVESKRGEGKVPIGLMGMGVWGSEDKLIEFGYDGEKYLNEGLQGGRLRSPVWVDVLGEASKEDVKPTEAASNGTTTTDAPVTAAPAVAVTPAAPAAPIKEEAAVKAANGGTE